VSDNWLAPQGWTAADLDANRAGRLSPAQIDELRRRMRKWMRRTAAWSLPWPLLALAPAIWLLVAQGDGSLFVLPIIGVLTVAPLFAIIGTRARGVIADAERGEVGIVEGPIAGMYVNTTTGTARVRIGETRMDCLGTRSDRTWQATRHFIYEAERDRIAVRAFYLPRARVIVAAEPL
jgi:hypothetical protein